MITHLVDRMANLIIKNKNSTKDPMYNPIFLKAGLAKIFHILDKITCQIDAKLIMCFDDDANISPEMLPPKYTCQANVSYDLNQLGDQYGEIEPNCTNAFIKTLTIVENFNYIECQEEQIPFDGLFVELLGEIASVDIYDSVSQAISILAEVYNSGQKIVNVIDKINIDENSGVRQKSRQIKHDLYQSTVISLANEDAHCLEGFNLEVDKADAFGQMAISVKSVTLEMDIHSDVDNPINIDVSTTCS